MSEPRPRTDDHTATRTPNRLSLFGLPADLLIVLLPLLVPMIAGIGLALIAPLITLVRDALR